MTDTSTPRRPFDPACDRWASFAALRVGDRIDYWGTARPVVEHTDFGDGRVRIVVDNGQGRDMAVAPGAEGTWRATRDDERVDPDGPRTYLCLVGRDEGGVWQTYEELAVETPLSAWTAGVIALERWSESGVPLERLDLDAIRVEVREYDPAAYRDPHVRPAPAGPVEVVTWRDLDDAKSEDHEDDFVADRHADTDAEAFELGDYHGDQDR